MKKKLLYIVNVDWFFFSHRLPIALEAQRKGFEVHIATSFTKYGINLKNYNFHLHSLRLERGKTNFFQTIVSVLQIFKIIKKVCPDILHLITIKPILYGGLIARLLKIPFVIVSISGLGFVFLEKNFFGILRKFFVKILYRYILNHKNIFVIFQNKYDRNYICKISNLNKKQTTLINGSGISLTDFKFKKYYKMNKIPIVFMASRLLMDKGLSDFVESAKILKKKIKVKFVLAGLIDRDNPSSVSESLLNSWVNKKYIHYVGFKKNIKNFLYSCSIAVLPSYREGFPKFLIEASSAGRAIVTTNVPGCRDAIIKNKTGILVPPRKPKKLAQAIKFLLNNIKIMKKMGQEGRKHAEKSFDIKQVVSQHITIYNKL